MLLNQKPPALLLTDVPAGGGVLEGGAAGLGRGVAVSSLDLQRLTWEHLETVRLKNLGLPNRYSRHLGRDFIMPREKHALAGPDWSVQLKPTPVSGVSAMRKDKKKASTNNSIAPFYTLAKPTCGYFFSRQTDNKKKKFGIPPSDLVKWRSFAQ